MIVAQNQSKSRVAGTISQEELELLIALQANETEMARLRSELDGFPEKIAAMESRLTAYLQAKEEKKAELDELNKAYRTHDSDLETNRARIAKREEQLRTVKTNKEYQSILKEIDEIRRKNSQIEDETLKCLDEIDSAKKAIEEQEKICQAENKSIESDRAVLNQQADDLRAQLAELEGKTQAICDQLDPKLVNHFRVIQSRAGGLGIVQVANAVCQGCHLNIPPQMYNELFRTTELRMCPHCHRLVYVV